jgi:DNA polymerase-1
MEALTLAAGHRFCRVRARSRGEDAALRDLLERLSSLREVRVVSYRGKDFMVQSSKACGMMPACDFDVQLASYLLNPSGVTHDLEAIAGRYAAWSERRAAGGQLGLLRDEAEEGKEEAEEDVSYALLLPRLAETLAAEMNLRGLLSLFEEVEMPLQEVLAEMEVCGVRLDREVLEAMEEELQEELRGLERQAHEMAGEAFNLNSPQQLSRILFEVLELPPVKRTKTGYATDVSVLTALRDRHPLPDLLLRHRELSKLLNTYVSALPRMLDPRTGRLHACFNQTVTATGRLSSSNPNLQNIPVRTPLGKSIRRAFVPTSADGRILAADYSQIERRALPHPRAHHTLRRPFRSGL